ncbi:MAG: hypothetical protein HQM14_17340 [SAR324 cluster bacterium]|nr:hypothetical protein [SAR324 cluster bacterium]
MIKKIFSFTKEDGTGLTQQEKLWIAKAIVGLATVNDHLHLNEKEHIVALYETLDGNPGILIAMNKVIKGDKPPWIDPISFPPELADQVFKYILQVAACDYEIPPEEIRYINQVGFALNINVLKIHKWTNFAIRQAKIEFFNQLKNDLNEEECYWLAHVVLKAIYIDKHIDKREILFFNDVYELLGENEAQINEAKADGKNLKLDHLPKVQFDHALTRRILQYLLRLTMSNIQVEESEIAFVRKIAQMLQYEEDELETIIASEHKLLLFLASSNNL